jgi:hypothetical protein
MRLNEVIAATDGVQGATVYKFPNLFAAPTIVEAQPVIAVKEPIVTNEPLAEVIPITGRVVSQELIDQDQRILLARQNEAEVRNEAAA